MYLSVLCLHKCSEGYSTQTVHTVEIVIEFSIIITKMNKNNKSTSTTEVKESFISIKKNLVVSGPNMQVLFKIYKNKRDYTSTKQ